MFVMSPIEQSMHFSRSAANFGAKEKSLLLGAFFMPFSREKIQTESLFAGGKQEDRTSIEDRLSEDMILHIIKYFRSASFSKKAEIFEAVRALEARDE